MKKIKGSILIRFFGIILFIYILAKIDIAELIASLKEINLIYYLLCILFAILGFLIRVWKWQTLTNSIGAKISFRRLTKISIKGFFLGLVTPGKLGEFWRAKYLTEETAVAGGKAFYTALMDRLLDILVVAMVGFSGLIVVYLKFGSGFGWQISILMFLCLAVLAYFLKRQKRFFYALLGFFIPSFLKKRAESFLVEFYQGFAGLKLKLFIKVLVLTFLYYLIGGPVLHYFVALSLGITIPFWYLFLIVAMVWLLLAIPVSIFGLGTREAGFIYFFSILGISSSLAVAFSLLLLLANILLAIPGAILFLKQK